MTSNGPPSAFFDILQQNGCLKKPKEPRFTFLLISDCLKIFIFGLKLGFLNIFQQTFIFSTIRLFNVRSDLYCVSTSSVLMSYFYPTTTGACYHVVLLERMTSSIS